ncbi:hypothetical protein GEMRC1_000108 [Eukaryota sp. GEM-RC1]
MSDETINGECIRNSIQQVIDDYELTNCVLAITTDCAANMRCGIPDGILHRLCAAHVINIVVQSGLDRVNQTLPKVLKFVKKSHKSPKLLRLLKLAAEAGNLRFKKFQHQSKLGGTQRLT